MRWPMAALLVATVAACSGPSAALVLPHGPGAQSSYAVQAQPPAGACHYRVAVSGESLPDRGCTPGALNPAVSESSLSVTVCRPGWAGSVRPPPAVTSREKAANARSYGFAGSLADAEYDHLVSLELGGDPNDPRNLWVEPGGVPNAKDGVESKLHAAVCAHRVSLALAQRAIARDWTAALDVLGLH